MNYLHHIIQNYSFWRPPLELFIIGFVVYSLTRFLQGTGGEKLFKGIIFLLLGYWGIKILTQALGLERIGFLFNYFIVMVLVVAGLAFQPELRRGLMRLGGAGLSRSAAPEMGKVIEQVVDAASQLSRAQIGALIAFERQVGLSDLVRNGTILDAEVTADLLHTIFWPGSPLHDMGVVLRGQRILAAGVQFPLAEHGEFDRNLGSRHRAAIGLSKETDAAVVVVSEETGNISLAVNGKLTRFLTLEQLHRQLQDLVMPVDARKHPGSKTPPQPE